MEDDDGEDAIREQNNEDESMEEEGDVKKTIRKEKTRKADVYYLCKLTVNSNGEKLEMDFFKKQVRMMARWSKCILFNLVLYSLS